MRKNKEGEELFDIDNFKKYYENKSYYKDTPKARTLILKSLKISPVQMSRSKGYR